MRFYLRAGFNTQTPGKQLYQSSPTFAQALNRCDAIFARETCPPAFGSYLSRSGTNFATGRNCQYTQPALFALEYALCEIMGVPGVCNQLLSSATAWGVRRSLRGGVFSLGGRTGPYLRAGAAHARRNLPARRLGGGPYGLLPTAEEMLQKFSGRVAIAALNGPGQTVISGAGGEVQAMLEKFAAAGIKHKELVVSHAFRFPR